MSDPTPDTLAQRLDRLERENRRFKRLSLMVLLALAALALVGQSSKVAKVIEAEKFVLRSPRGTVRASLEVLADAQPEGTARMVLFDRNGKKRVELAQQPYRPNALTVFGEDETPLATLGAHLSNTLLAFPAHGADEGVAIGVSKGQASLVFTKDGNVIWKAP